MNKVDRSKRINFIAQYVPLELDPILGVYFGEHVIRVNGQLCLVVNSSGQVGIRALHPSLVSELTELCQGQHWVAHGRVYEQWFLLPEDIALNDKRVARWIRSSSEEVFRLSQVSNIPNRQA